MLGPPFVRQRGLPSDFLTGCGAVSVSLYGARVALSAAARANKALASAMALGAWALASAYAFVVCSLTGIVAISPVLAWPILVNTLTGGTAGGAGDCPG